MKRFALLFALMVGVVACAVQAADDAEWKAQVQAELKALREQNAALQKRVDANDAHAKEIKMDASVQKAIDNAVARAGTGAKYSGGAFLAPDRPDVKGIGLTFTGEFLYWKPLAQNQDFIERKAFPGRSTTPTHASIQGVEFDWSAGYRLGLGYRLPYDGWDVIIKYTHFDTDGERNLFDSGQNMEPLLTGDPTSKFVHATTHFRYDVIDAEFGRNSKVSETLSVRPFAGFRWAGIGQTLKAHYIANGNAQFIPLNSISGKYVIQHSSADLFGIRAGLDGDWKIWKDCGSTGANISIYGSASGALLTGEFDTKKSGYRISPGGNAGPFGTFLPESTWTENNSSRIIPNIQLSAGVAYQHKFGCDLVMKASLGYELTNYFGAARQLRPQDEASNYVVREGDIGLHGLVFKIKLDF